MKIASYFLITVAVITLTCTSIKIPDAYNDVYEIFSAESKTSFDINQLSLDEKIGQLFMIPVYTDQALSHQKEILELIEKQKIGGVIFMKGHPKKQANWTETFQKNSKIPLLVAMDAEWGLSMRLDSVLQYPKQMTLGAVKEDSLIYSYGKRMAQELKWLGVNVSFSPVIDINNNPHNPVIHVRSFGENKYEVANKGLAYMKGLQDEGVLAVAKHFPGHGDTEVDSHKDLPVINLSKNRIHNTELHPFKHLFKNGVGGLMTAHVFMPAFERQKGLPASLSEKIGIKLLRKQLEFEGLTFSDALNMKGVTKNFKTNEIDLLAFLAGNDVLLFPQNIDLTIAAIKDGIEKGKIHLETLDEKVTRILKVKQWITEKQVPQIKDSLIVKTKKPKEAEGLLLNQLIAEAAITSLNADHLLPLKTGVHRKITLIDVGGKATEFKKTAEQYYRINYKSIPLKELSKEQKNASFKVTENDTVLLILSDVNPYKIQQKFGFSESNFQQINSWLQATQQSLLVNFGSPYILENFRGHPTLQCYELLPSIELAAAQCVFGALGSSGKLPVSVPGVFNYSAGNKLKAKKILGIGLPESVGMSSENLKAIDSIAEYAIAQKATPGCQILVAKNGKIVYHKSFGHHTYEDSNKVKNTDVYDLASITKIAASTLLLMRSYDLGLIDPNKTLGYYLNGNIIAGKKDITLREVLCHQAGLLAWIPFYNYTLDENGFCDSNYCYMPNNTFSVQVADNLYINKDIADSILQIINRSPLKKRGEYKYSDLGYFYLKRILDSLTNDKFYPTLKQQFYNPMGIHRLFYHPLNYLEKTEIIPTENDNYFRRQLIHGYVHDQAASMLGGIAGHAGLFSDAYSLAIYMQMIMNQGEYGDERYLKSSTVKLFTSQQFENNRKGLGFDKPEMDKRKATPTIRAMSDEAFGHTGFTGTSAWADPKYDLVYIFLSNRVYPTAENKKLLQLNTRTEIMQVIYNDILKK